MGFLYKFTYTACTDLVTYAVKYTVFRVNTLHGFSPTYTFFIFSVCAGNVPLIASLPDEMLTASSTHTLPRFSPARSRLHTPPVNEGDTEYEILAGGWAADYHNDNPQWLQAEFQESHYINTEGNFDRNTVVTNTFDPVNARMVRLNVVEFHGYTTMRWELYACV